MNKYLINIQYWFLTRLNWLLVRSLGELQILTRISYMMLIIVPLLAATWPTIRLIINQEINSANDAVITLENSISDFEQLHINNIELLENNNELQGAELLSNLTNIVNDLTSFEKKVRNEYLEESQKYIHLPWSFAAGFFASLLIIIGQMIYQLLAHETIKKKGWDDFITGKLYEYTNHPSPEALKIAHSHIQSRVGKRVNRLSTNNDNNTLSKMYTIYTLPGKKNLDNLALEIQSLNFSDLISLKSSIDGKLLEAPEAFLDVVSERINNRINSNIEIKNSLDISTIERGARVEYLILANKNTLGALLTGLFYISGIFIILSIITVQSISVYEAANLTSISDIFYPTSSSIGTEFIR